MKFKMMTEKGEVMVIPKAAQELAHFKDEAMELEVERSVLIIKRNEMTARQLVETICSLEDVAMRLWVDLMNAFEMERGSVKKNFCVEEWNGSSCDKCAHERKCQLIVPPCLLEEAEMDPEGSLIAYEKEGQIIIEQDEDYDEELNLKVEAATRKDVIPAQLLPLIHANGIDQEQFESFLAKDAVVYGVSS